MVNHNGATRGQGHDTRIRRLNLVFDLESGKKRHIVVVALHTRTHIRHDVQHELTGLLADVIGVDQDLADIGVEIIANRANHKA